VAVKAPSSRTIETYRWHGGGGGLGVALPLLDGAVDIASKWTAKMK
jgi:hypothetical protein